MEKALTMLNESCVEAGVCPGEMVEADAKKVHELYHPEKKDKILLVLWSDNHVTACYKKDAKDSVCCYHTSTPEFFYITEAFFTEASEKFGYRVRELHPGEPSEQ